MSQLPTKWYGRRVENPDSDHQAGTTKLDMLFQAQSRAYTAFQNRFKTGFQSRETATDPIPTQNVDKTLVARPAIIKQVHVNGWGKDATCTFFNAILAVGRPGANTTPVPDGVNEFDTTTGTMRKCVFLFIYGEAAMFSDVGLRERPFLMLDENNPYLRGGATGLNDNTAPLFGTFDTCDRHRG
ncbi:hypothetical protein Ddc_18595 [Ditylenchus destructor]|nr:hypothetical protein Ddc_18595 [Ditylenchus destructor]